MKCADCRLSVCSSSCPDYVPPIADYYCAACGEGIYPGEEYVKNEDNDFIHYECIGGIRELLDFLGYEVETVYD